MISVLQLTFWGSVATVVFITIGYPLLLLVASPFVRRRRILDAAEPHVTMVIAAYNEESVIEAKLHNSLTLDYPRHKLDIVVASDGSSDRTNPIVRQFASQGVILEEFPRTGKTGMQNQVSRKARGEILLFSDANAHYRADAIRMLVRNFADPAIGGVCGQLDYIVAGEGAAASESLYWRYEKFIKQRESTLSSTVGANGSIYAIRKCDYVEIDPGLISDFVEPLAIVRRGKRMVYEPEAVSIEAGSVNYGIEFRRKVRILTRSIRGLLSMASLFNPFRYGVFSLQLAMHKLLRFITPVFLIIGAVALCALAILGHYRGLFLLSVVVVLLSIGVVGCGIEFRLRIVGRALHLLYYYLMANYALILAWLNIARGNRMTMWAPERPQS